MELSRQIRKYRNQAGLSQDELAEKVFVSRQTISSWENDKSYPDVKSLVLLSEVFQVSLDQLIKGDIEKMKQMMDQEELMNFQKDSHIFTLLFAAMLILPVPMVMIGKWIGMAGYVVIAAAGLFYAYKIEQYKKKYDIQTYKEIVAFMEGKSLDEIEKAKESGKRPYQRMLLAAGAALLTLLIALIMAFLFKKFM